MGDETSHCDCHFYLLRGGEFWQHKVHMQVMDVACHCPEFLGDVEVIQLV